MVPLHARCVQPGARVDVFDMTCIENWLLDNQLQEEHYMVPHLRSENISKPDRELTVRVNLLSEVSFLYLRILLVFVHVDTSCHMEDSLASPNKWLPQTKANVDTGLPAYSDSAGTVKKCHCKRGRAPTLFYFKNWFGNCQNCHCNWGVTLTGVTVSGEACNVIVCLSVRSSAACGRLATAVTAVLFFSRFSVGCGRVNHSIIMRGPRTLPIIRISNRAHTVKRDWFLRKATDTMTK